MNQEKTNMIIMNGRYLKCHQDVVVEAVLGKCSTFDRQLKVSFSFVSLMQTKEP